MKKMKKNPPLKKKNRRPTESERVGDEETTWRVVIYKYVIV
jgi:hypothetical protein